MKTIAIILLSSLFSSAEDKFYHNRDMICSFSCTITKDWELKLSEKGMFKLIVRVKDTRKKDVAESTFMGTWENNRDTIVLNAVSPSANECYWTQTKYILLNSSLKQINENTCLPVSLSPGRMLLDKYKESQFLREKDK